MGSRMDAETSENIDLEHELFEEMYNESRSSPTDYFNETDAECPKTRSGNVSPEQECNVPKDSRDMIDEHSRQKGSTFGGAHSFGNDRAKRRH